jgi:DNA anti-recombination protein RmuC
MVTGLQEQVYSKKMFNERADAVEKLAALQEELQQQRVQADTAQKQALAQQQNLAQQISDLQQECSALRSKISKLENDANQANESSAAAAAASAAAASARITELESENLAALAAAKQQVL